MPAVLHRYTELLETCYANPASLHSLGLASEKILREASRQIRQSTGADASRLTMTSGGSESINLAIKGYLQANRRLPSRIITSAGEHAATREVLAFLEQQGYVIDRVALSRDGGVDLDRLAEALGQPAALLTLIHVSNETGAVNPIQPIVRLRNRLQPDLAIHLDSVQAFGKIPVRFDPSGIQMMSGSGHKLGAPKGSGWLLHRAKIRLTAQIHGGGQQNGLRGGTENPPLAAATALALQLSVETLTADEQKIRQLRQRFLDEIRRRSLPVQPLIPVEGVPQILAVTVPGLRAETLVQAMAARQVFISAGSACSSKKKRLVNEALQAAGLSAEQAMQTVRISFAGHNTDEEIMTAAKQLQNCLEQLIRV